MMGGVSSALVGFSYSDKDGAAGGGKVISNRTIDIITSVYTPLAIAILAYALFMFEMRRWSMQKKQVRSWRGVKPPLLPART